MDFKRRDLKSLSRTQLLIMNALFELMKEDDFNKITVTQIIQESEIARGTFYLNFKTKEEVLKCFIQALTNDYDDRMSIYQEHTPYLMALHFFEYWQKHFDFANLLCQQNLFYLLLDSFENYMNEISTKWVPSKVFNRNQMTAEEVVYFSSFNSAGLWNMLLRWIKGGAVETPEVMAKIYEKITN